MSKKIVQPGTTQKILGRMRTVAITATLALRLQGRKRPRACVAVETRQLSLIPILNDIATTTKTLRDTLTPLRMPQSRKVRQKQDPTTTRRKLRSKMTTSANTKRPTPKNKRRRTKFLILRTRFTARIRIRIGGSAHDIVLLGWLRGISPLGDFRDGWTNGDVLDSSRLQHVWASVRRVERTGGMWEVGDWNMTSETASSILCEEIGPA
jgi:hypothetical protein